MNEAIFFFFYNLAHQSKIFDKIVVFFAEIFPYIIILLAVLFLSRRFSRDPDPQASGLFNKKWKEFFLVFASSGLAWLIAKVLKILFHTLRPFLALPDVHPLFIKTTFSFPSEHTTFFMALAVSIFFMHKKVGYVFMFFALIIGLSRIIAGVHFPIDILGGFILGFLVAYSLKNV